MDIRIKEKLKNQQGSSLAFVLIIGMVIMIMAASLLVVANSDFTFAQETVESRQAYIDAKSVIEFGKIEINSRVTNLNTINEKLYQTYKDYKAAVELNNSTEVNRLSTLISSQEAQRDGALSVLKSTFDIYGDIANISETCSNSSSSGEKVGSLRVEEAGNQFKFIIETENLRRKLDYTISFSYDPSSKTETQKPGGTKPEKPIDRPITGKYAKVNIHVIGNVHDPYLKANIVGEGNDKEIDENGELELNINDPDYSTINLEIEKKNNNQFEWMNGRTLNMVGKNILVSEQFPTDFTDSDGSVSHFNMTAVGSINQSGELRVVQDYYQKNKGLNKFEADNVIFEKGVKIGDKGISEIKCKNLFIKGDLELQSENSKLIIEADNIVISGNVKMAKGTTIETKCKNLFMEGDLELKSANSKLKIDADNIVMSKNVKMESGTTIETNCKNVWVDGHIELLASNTLLSCTNLENFNSGDIYVGSWSEIKLNGNANSQIKIGNVTTQSSGAKLTFENVNYLKTGDMALEMSTQLTVKGAQGKLNNQMVSGEIKPKTYSSNNDQDKAASSINTTTAIAVNVVNLASFSCNGLILDKESTLNLDSRIVNIKADLILFSMKDPIAIATQYIDITGHTYIGTVQGSVNISPIDGILNVRFNGGYSQFYSTVNLNGANKIVFSGDTFYLKGDEINDLTLNAAASDIYLATDDIQIKQYYGSSESRFFYSGKNGSEATNLHIKTSVIWQKLDWPTDTYTVQSGDYSKVRGQFPKIETADWLYKMTPTTYSEPEWEKITAPAVPGTGGTGSGGNTGSNTGGNTGGSTSGSSVSVTEGAVILCSSTEKYY